MRNYSHDGLDFTYMKKVHYSMRDSNAKVGTGPGRGSQMVYGARYQKVNALEKEYLQALAVCIGRARENYKFSTSITSRASLF